MKKYFILASLTLLCCMFFSCSSDDDAEKELDLTGTWYLSSYDEYDEDDDKVTTITVSKVDATRKKIFTKRAGQVYDVQSINRHYIPNELGYIDYENPQLGDWEVGTTETYIFKDDKLITDQLDYDVLKVDSKKIVLGLYVYLSFDNPNLKMYITHTYSKMD